MKKNVIIVLISLAVLILGIFIVNCFYPFYTSFNNMIGIDPEDIEYIAVKNGNTGTVYETHDSETIKKLFKDFDSISFTRSFNEQRDGWSYSINIYPKNNKGHISYTVQHGFNKYDGFKSGHEGNFTESDPEKAEQILKNLYESLA